MYGNGGNSSRDCILEGTPELFFEGQSTSNCETIGYMLSTYNATGQMIPTPPVYEVLLSG